MSQLFNSAQASDWLRTNTGVCRSAATLAKLRSVGGGPRFIKVGKTQVRYRPDDLAMWADQLCQPCVNTFSAPVRLVR